MEIIWKYVGNCLEILWKISGNILGICGNTTEIVWGLSGKTFEIVRKQPGIGLEIPWKTTTNPDSMSFTEIFISQNRSVNTDCKLSIPSSNQ